MQCISAVYGATNPSHHRLCRYNIAKSRQLRHDGKPGHAERTANGRYNRWYYDNKQIPIARTEEEQGQLIKSQIKFQNGEMPEVLVKPPVSLPNNTQVSVFSGKDQKIALKIIKETGVAWRVSLANAPKYQACPQYLKACEQFIQTSLKDENWRGDGLEFDRV